MDVDDSWDDVVIINTFNQQPMLYMNSASVKTGHGWVWRTNGRAVPRIDKRPAVDVRGVAGDLTGNGAHICTS